MFRLFFVREETNYIVCVQSSLVSFVPPLLFLSLCVCVCFVSQQNSDKTSRLPSVRVILLRRDCAGKTSLYFLLLDALTSENWSGSLLCERNICMFYIPCRSGKNAYSKLRRQIKQGETTQQSASPPASIHALTLSFSALPNIMMMPSSLFFLFMRALRQSKCGFPFIDSEGRKHFSKYAFCISFSRQFKYSDPSLHVLSTWDDNVDSVIYSW